MAKRNKRDAEQFFQPATPAAAGVEANTVRRITSNPEQDLCLPTKAINDTPPDYLTHPVKIISRYNYKGGVGKTTSCFTSAWELALHNPKKRVLMVDADSQCSLTQLVLSRTVNLLTGGTEDYNQYFERFPGLPGVDEVFARTCTERGLSFNGRWNLFLALLPAMRPAVGASLKPSQLVTVALGPDRPSNLFFLPGSERINELDEELARASVDPSPAFRGQLGAFYHLLRMTAAVYKIDLILIDLPPALSAWTRVSMLSSDYFIIPFQPDFFSMRAITALRRVFAFEDANEDNQEGSQRKRRKDIPDEDVRLLEAASEPFQNWVKWFETSRALEAKTRFPMKGSLPKFLGGHLTRFRRAHVKGGDELIANHRYWLDHIVREIQRLNEALPANSQADHGSLRADWRDSHPLLLGLVEEYNQLVNISQRESMPVTQLQEHTLTVPDENGNLTKSIRQDEKAIMVQDSIPRHRQYYEQFVQNFSKLVQF